MHNNDHDEFPIPRDSIWYWPAMAGATVLGCAFVYALLVAIPTALFIAGGAV